MRYKIEQPSTELNTDPDLSQDEWVCHLFGSDPNKAGLRYVPNKYGIPNWFHRLMMKWILGCTWVRSKK